MIPQVGNVQPISYRKLEVFDVVLMAQSYERSRSIPQRGAREGVARCRIEFAGY